MIIEKIYSKDSFEMANVLVSVDKWVKHQTVDIPQAREDLKVIADTIDMVYVNGLALELKKNEIAEIVQDTFKGMDKRTVSKMRVYSNEYDNIIAYLDKIGSNSVSVDRMVQTYQSNTNKVKKEREGGLKAWVAKTYTVPTPEDTDTSYPASQTTLEVGKEITVTDSKVPVEKETASNIFMRLARCMYDAESFIKGFSQEELEASSEGTAKFKSLIDLELKTRFEAMPKVVNL